MIVKQSDFLPSQALHYPILLIGDINDTTAIVINCLSEAEDIPLCIRRLDEILQLKTVSLAIHVIDFLCKSTELYLVRGPDDEVRISSVLEFSREYKKGGYS